MPWLPTVGGVGILHQLLLCEFVYSKGESDVPTVLVKENERLAPPHCPTPLQQRSSSLQSHSNPSCVFVVRW